MRYEQLACLLLATSLSGSPVVTEHPDPSWRLQEDLVQAVERGDRPRVIELVNTVLQDELGEEFRFDDDLRSKVESVILEMRLLEVAPLIRRVASLSYTGDEPQGGGESDARVFRKLRAIRGALLDLTVLRDSEAVAANRRHIATPIVASLAIRNLQDFADWASTDEVRHMTEDRQPTRMAFLDLAAALEFVARSPLAVAADCQIGVRLRTAYGACFETDGPADLSGCGTFVVALRTLEERFSCRTQEKGPGPRCAGARARGQ